MVWNLAMLIYFDILYTTGHSESRAVLSFSFFSLGQVIKSLQEPNLIGIQRDSTWSCIYTRRTRFLFYIIHT